MRNHAEIMHPHHCFCQIPETELLYWLKKRYLENTPTLELLAATADPHEKEVISIVSLLDVDEATMLELMGDVAMPEHHIVHCREDVKKLLDLHRTSR